MDNMSPCARLKVHHDRVTEEIEVERGVALKLFVASIFIGGFATLILSGFKSLPDMETRSAKNLGLFQLLAGLLLFGYVYAIYTNYKVFRNSKLGSA
jgi:heme/copper-type cytochrome/quinol oxidase subunit 1